MSNFAFTGGFTPDRVDPTCVGLGKVIDLSQKLPREVFLVVARTIEAALWTQPLPPNTPLHPVLETLNDLVAALNNGWAYNANEGDLLWCVFTDIRAIVDANRRHLGIGCRAADGAFIHDGRELVAWRDRRWIAMRGPDHLKEVAKANPLRVIRGNKP